MWRLVILRKFPVSASAPDQTDTLQGLRYRGGMVGKQKAFFVESSMFLFTKVAFCSSVGYLFADVDKSRLSTFSMCITVDNLDNFVDKQSIFP